MADYGGPPFGAGGEGFDAPLVRVRPFCRVHQEHAVYLWRCFCYPDDPKCPAVCRCEAHGVWLCEWADHEMPDDGGVMLYG